MIAALNSINEGEVLTLLVKLMNNMACEMFIQDNDAPGWKGLKEMGDCLSKGAFGSVYTCRALNWNTGETVAVKQTRLPDLFREIL
jgi:hypothetical protein